MPVIIEKYYMPSKCNSCPFQNRVGGCDLLSPDDLADIGYEEFDEEWQNARKEGRRLKYCPMKEVTRCKDCAFCVRMFTCKKNEDQIWRCQRFGLNMIDFDGYCSWAQRYNGLDKEKEE